VEGCYGLDGDELGFTKDVGWFGGQAMVARDKESV